MVEVKLHSDLRVASLKRKALRLSDQNLIMMRCEAGAFVAIQVDIAGFDARREIRGRQAACRAAVANNYVRVRGNNALLKTLELDVNLDTVELQTGQSQCLPTVLGVPPREGHKQSATHTGVAHERCAAVALQNASDVPP